MCQSPIPNVSSDTPPAAAFYFRIRFLGPALWLGTLTSVVTALLIALDNPRGAPDAVGFLIVRLFPIPVAVLFLAVVALLCPIRVTARGIKYPAWPLLVREMRWDEMHAIHYVNLLGLRFLAIYRIGAATGLWLPLFIKNRGQFCDLLSACAGKDHPLVVSLIKYCIRRRDTGCPADEAVDEVFRGPK